jgi:hypothetical protein
MGGQAEGGGSAVGPVQSVDGGTADATGGTTGGSAGSGGDGGPLVCYQVTGSGSNQLCHYQQTEGGCSSGYAFGKCPSRGLDGCCVVTINPSEIYGGCFYNMAPVDAIATKNACGWQWQSIPP